MKNKGVTLIFILLSLIQFSCDENPAGTSSGKSIKGNGVLSAESRFVNQFRYIHLTGSFDVDVEDGKSDSIIVSADENIVPHIKTHVSGDCLYISPDTSVSPVHRMKLVFKKNDIEKVFIIGEAEVSLARVNTNSFGIDIDGAGNVDVAAVVDSVSVVVNGSADIMVNVDRYLNVKINGMGNISYKGNPAIVQNVSGLVNLKKME